MTPETLKEAIAEANRFICVAGNVRIEKIVGTHQATGKTWLNVVEGNKESAACRRASMDLTRVLAKLRRGQ